MRELFNIIRKYYLFFLFLLVESIAIILLVQRNDFQRSAVVNAARTMAGNYYRRMDALREYLTLRETNRQLALENTRLKNLLRSSYRLKGDDFANVTDTLPERNYRFISARVVNNSSSRQYNYFTLDKGSQEGIRPDMAVATSDGIVGVVIAVSPHFSQVISLLNRDFKVSARLKRSNEPGSLSWTGTNHRFATLSEIPHDASIVKGDTVITSGLTPIFPEGWPIGFVEDFDVEGGSFYTVKVRLANDFRKLQWVMVIENLLKDEQINLENRLTE
jgi:rod shape-determining protein MreC